MQRLHGLLLVSALLLPGCLAGAVSTGALTPVYLNGAYQARLPTNPDRGAKAAKAVLESMNMTVGKYETSELASRVETKRANGEEIVVTYQRQDEEFSKIEIRVGPWGDEQFSRELYQKIQAQL